MKLRTKIVLLTSVMIFTAIFISEAVIWMMIRKNQRMDAVHTVSRDAVEAADACMLFFADTETAYTNADLAYFFKSQHSDCTICLWDDVEIYNQTILTAEELSHSNCRILPAEGKLQRDTGYFFCRKSGHQLAVGCISRYIAGRQLTVFQICDLEQVNGQLSRLAAIMLCIAAAVTGVVCIAMLWILERAFLPLETLSQTTKAIAAGAYEQRVQISGSDEISSLGKDFNGMAEAVKQRNDALLLSEERKTMLMGSLTHELKTPLTAIYGYAQTLLAAKLPEEDRLSALHYICSESERLDRLSKKMMRLLELDREVPLQMQEEPIARLFADARDICAGSAKEKQIQIEIGPCEGNLYCEYDLFCDALVNLLDNALRYSSPESRVLLYTDHGEIIVEDFGCGIPREEIDRITDAFYMVDKSRSRKSGGAGLGLALVKLILQHHGMSLRIESTLGAGTRMILHFVDTPLNT
ncbi:MAG: HAMP domain-containing histidine kinase [Oscillospiraceae bacterium]|nr:HAMP domain-containing histidine kinase [Oscillospiraceae bacterium]